MNLNIEEIPQDDLKEFKRKVKEWVQLNKEINELNNQIKILKKKKVEYEPELTKFIIDHNVEALNTEIGKVKCCERNTKKALNKQNIKDNLSSFIDDNILLEKAMDQIWENREIKTSYKLTISKKK